MKIEWTEERQATIARKVAERAAEVDGCLIWKGSFSGKARHPALYFERTKLYTRRLIWEAANGPLPKNVGVRCNCGNPACVALEHLYTSARSEWQKGKPMPINHRIKLAKVARRRSSLSDSQVSMIRSSSELGYVLAKQLGVSRQVISRVRRYRSHIQFNSPFAGLHI